jgi:hypothetical protein
LWVGANQYAGTISAFLIVLVVAQFAFICNDASIIDLTLKLKHKVFLGAVSLVLSLLTSIVLVAYFKLGIVGLCIGIILGRSILTFGYPILVARLLRYSFYTQLRGVVQPVIIAMIFFSAAAYASKYLPSTGWDGILGWLYFFLLCGLTLGVASVLAFYSGLSPHQQKNIISRIKIILNRPQV